MSVTSTSAARVEYHASRRFPWLPVCDCGTVFAGYVREHAAQLIVDDHRCPEVLMMAPLEDRDGLVLAHRSFAPAVTTALDAAMAADPELEVFDWLAARPAVEVVLTEDGHAVDVTSWCAHQSSEWVRYERWTAAGRVAHGYVCERVGCRRVTQTG